MEQLKLMVQSIYDIQKVRMAIGNRISINFRNKLGQEPSKKTEEMPEIGKKILSIIVKEHARLTDAIANMKRRDAYKFLNDMDGVISNRLEYEFVGIYLDMVEKEKGHKKVIEKALKGIPIHEEFLKDVKGVGPLMSGVIVSTLDPHKARTPSSFWKYAGLDVAEDGRGRSWRKEHLIEVDYIDKEGKEKQKKSITYNPFLKTKLVGVLASSFLKSKSPYSEIYYDTKQRLENHAVYKDVSKGHRHNMANRKMVKIFLLDLWLKWREIEGLELRKPYHEEKLGMMAHGS